MSGFLYHLQCPACGAVGPALAFGTPPFEEPRIELPASDLASGALSRLLLPEDDQTRHVPLVELARRHDTARLRVSAPTFDEAGNLRLEPPLPCPRCGASLEEATWGAPPDEEDP
jgi:hypothetical protein